MADLIDRDALLKDLRSVCPESDVCFSHESCIDCIVKRQPAVNHWIPVEDGLPEQGEEVWCCCYGSDIVIPDYEHGETVAECIARTQKDIVTVQIGFVDSDGWYTIDGYPMIIAPTYWMQLHKPEPPEKE